TATGAVDADDLTAAPTSPATCTRTTAGGSDATFTLFFDGKETAPLSYNATATQIAAALNATGANAPNANVTVENGRSNSLTTALRATLWKITFNTPRLVTPDQFHA